MTFSLVTEHLRKFIKFASNGWLLLARLGPKTFPHCLHNISGFYVGPKYIFFFPFNNLI